MLNENQINIINEMAKRGIDKNIIAKKLGVSLPTIYKYLEEGSNAPKVPLKLDIKKECQMIQDIIVFNSRVNDQNEFLIHHKYPFLKGKKGMTYIAEVLKIKNQHAPSIVPPLEIIRQIRF